MPGEDKFVFAPRFVNQTFEMAMYRVQDLEINTTYDEVQASVAAKEEEFLAASAAAQAIAADIASKSAAATSKQADISAIALSVPVAASNLAIALGKLEALVAESASLIDQLADITAALATNATSVAAKQAQIDALAALPGNGAALSVLVAELAVLTLRRSDLQAVSADLSLEVAAEAAEIQAQRDTINIQSAQAGYDPVKMAELVVQTTTLEELKDERAALAADLAVVNQQLTSNAAAIRSKQASIGILTAKPGDNSAAITVLQSELAALQVVKTGLQTEAAQLTASLAAKDATVAAQQTVVDALATQAGANSASVALMTVKIVVRDALTSEVSVLQDSKLAYDDQTAQLATVVAVAAVPPTEVEWDSEPGTLAAAARLTTISHDLADATVADRYSVVSGDIPPGTTFSSEGLLTGTVTTAGDYTFTVRAGTNFPTQFSDKVFSLHVAPEVLWQTATLSNLELQGAGQTRAFVAINAIYFEVLTGTLPAGTTLAPGGMLSGTPTAYGTSSFTVRATSDHPDIYLDRAFTLQVVSTPVWSTPAALTDVAKSEGYSVQLVAPTIDGTTTFAVQSGALPTGLTLSAAGLLSGTPSSAGSVTWAVRATGINAFADRTFTQVIANRPVWTTGAALANTAQSVAYTTTLAASNGFSPGFSVVSGFVPTGTTLSDGGVLSGTPTALATYTFAVRSTSSTSPIIYADRTFTQTTVPLPIWVTAGGAYTDVPQGVAITSVQLSATNALTYAVSTGSLPTGLSLSSAGLLSGTPISGSYSWTVRATGSATNATADRSFSMLVATVPTWTTGAALANTSASVTYSVTLSATNASATGFSLLSGTLPTGTTLSSSGVLSGTPSTIGTFSWTVRALSTTSAIIYADRAFTQTVVPLPVWSSPAAGALADFATGSAYSQQFTATNAVTYTVQTGTIPTGLSLSSGGLLSGTPSAGGSYSFTIRATGNATNATADRSFTQLVTAPPSWNTGAALVNTAISVAYSVTLSASSANPTGYSVTAGTLPTGTTLTNGGVLSGTPNALGTYSFTVRALSTTSSIIYTDRTFTQTVVALPAWSSPAAGALTDVAAGSGYSQQFTATNTVSYSVQTGAIPSGLSLSSGGLLNGTPSAGSYSFTIRATGNASNATADRAFTQLVATTPTWNTGGTLANTAQNVSYSFQLSANNGNAYSVVGGTLPSGVSLSSGGLLSGTPNTTGSSSFTVRVTSTTSTSIYADRAFALTVVTVPVWSTSATLTSVTEDVAYSLQLSASPIVSYSLKSGSAYPAGITMNGSGLLSGAPTDPGTYTFTITANGDAANATADRTFTLVVTAAASTNVTSSGTYTLNLPGMPAASSFYVDNVTDGGSWILVYETAASRRNGSGFIPYAVDKKADLGSAAVTRLAYRLQNNGQYAWASFPAWSGSYDVPTGGSSGNLFTNRRDVTNMNVISNASNVTNVTNTSGTLEIWPSDYNTGSGQVYDGNDDGYGTGPGYGCFQVFNSSINQCVFAWNRHGNNETQDVGFGNAPGQHPDWTFVGNGAAGDFKLQIFAYAGSLSTYTSTFSPIRYLSFKPLSVNGGGTQVQMTQASFCNASGAVVSASMSLVGTSVYIQGTGFTTNQQCFDSLQNFGSVVHCNFGPIPTSMIVYDFGSSATCSTVKSFYLGGSDDSNRFPNNILIQGSANSDMSNAVTLHSAAPQTGFGFNNTGLKAADIAIPTEAWEYKIYDMRSWAVDRSIWAADVNDGNRTFYSFTVPSTNTVRVTDDFIAFSIVGQSGTAWQKYYYDGVGFNISGTNFNVSITEASGGSLSANGVSYTSGQASVTTGVAASSSTWSSVLKVTVTTTSVDAAVYYTADGTVNTDALGSLVLRYVWTLSAPFTASALKGNLTSFNSRMYNGYEPARMVTNFYDFTGKHYRSSNWETRVASAGGSASTSIKSAVDSLVKKLDSGGVLYKMRRLSAFVGDQWTAALVPILNTIGSTTDTTGNMSSSDYTVLTGFKGNGSNKYINTGFNLNSVSGNGTNMHMALMALTTANGRLMGVARANEFTKHYMFDGGFSWGNGGSRTPGPLGGEHMIATRAGSGPAYFYSVGKQTGSHTTPDGSQPPDLAVIILAHNQSPSGGSDGNINSFSTSNVGGYSMGFNITAENAAAYSAAMSDFNDSMGRNVNRIAGGATLLPSGTTVSAVVPSLNGFHTPYMLFNNGIKHVDSTNTHYHTVAGYTSDTITVTFTTSYKVASMRLWRRDGDDFYATNMRVEGGPVGGPYTTVYETSGVIPPAHGLNSSQWDAYEAQGYGEYVIHSTQAYPVYRFVFTYSQGYLSLGEMMLYGTPAIVNDETKSWKARVVANGGTVNASVVAAVDVFVSALKTAGILTKMSRMNLFCGNELAAAMVPLVNTMGTPTDLSTGFGASDYSQSTGLQGGTGKYVDTGLGLSSLSPNGLNLHLSVSTLTAASGFMLGYIESTEYSVNDNNYGYGWGGWYARSPVSQGAEHIVATRSTSGPSYFYSNSVQTGSQASPSGIATSGQTMTVLAGRYDNNGTVGGYTNAKVATYSVGTYLTASDVTAYRNAVAAFNTSMGR